MAGGLDWACTEVDRRGVSLLGAQGNLAARTRPNLVGNMSPSALDQSAGQDVPDIPIADCHIVPVSRGRFSDRAEPECDSSTHRD